ncbi:MAG: DUF305 domain-containing protein [Rhodoglobus sp.]
MLKKNKALSVIAVLGASLALSACSGAGMEGMDMGQDTSSSPAATVFNDADVSFATQMAVHHSQAIDMAQTVLDKSDIDPRVTELAQKIKDAQQPEIDQLNSWLEEWGSGDMVGMDMGGGTMSQSDMDALAAATGVEASKLFLEQMTVHHQGAIEMAQIEVDSGENPAARALAQKIIDDQTAEIEEIKAILATL